MKARIHMEDSSKRIFAIHGGGNIGLGLMADVVSRSLSKYQIVATSSDKLVQKVVNSTHQLWLQHNSKTKQLTRIKNVTIVSRDFKDIVSLYKEAAILAICLTPSAFKSSLTAIAQGLLERYRNNKAKLSIFVLMNLPDCAEMVREKVMQKIFSLANNKEEATKVYESVKFIPTVVDRVVTKVSENDIREQLKRHFISCLSIDFIDSKWLNKKVRFLLEEPEKLAEAVCKLNFQFSLFNAESSFALYTSSQTADVMQFPSITQVNNLNQLEAIKNKYINGPHAILAWLGALLGCKTIASAINYPGMKQFIETTIDREIAPALRAEYPTLTGKELAIYKKLFFDRCEASIDDPVVRVGRDPLRKINSGERVRGTIEMGHNQRLNLSMGGLEFGIAAAILYAVKKIDPTNPECQKICEIYDKNKSYKEVLCYQGPYSSGIFYGLDPKANAQLITNILNQLEALEKICELHKMGLKSWLTIPKAEFSTRQVLLHISANRALANNGATTIAVRKNISVSVNDLKSESVSPRSENSNRYLKAPLFLNKQKLQSIEGPMQIRSSTHNYGSRQ